MNRDSLFNISADSAMHAAYNALSSNQHLQPHEQVAAIAVLFHAVMESTGLTRQELMNIAIGVKKDADLFYAPQVRALADYMKYEIDLKL